MTRRPKLCFRLAHRSGSHAAICALVPALLLATGNAVADRGGHSEKCKRLHAQIVAAPVQEGCTSQFGLCTSGIIDGNRGLDGTTFFTADSVVNGPLTAPDPGTTKAYSGLLVITTRHGTITARDTGVFNPLPAGTTPTAGFFSSFDLIESGTGRYEGATGTFVTGGKTVNGQFVSNVEGEICLQR